MKKIMLATDFSTRSDRALRRATLLAQQFDASLLIVHVIDDDQPDRIVEGERKQASELLQELRSTLLKFDGVSCETRIVLADPFVGIVKAAQEEMPDVLVIGPHRRQALRDVFVGTTAERTIRSADCPVLMVNAPPVAPYAHVLLATDLSEGAECAVKASEALGLLRGANVSFLHIYDAPATRLAMSHTVPSDDRELYLEELHKEALSNLAQFIKKTGVQSQHQLVNAELHEPAKQILIAAKNEAADLVVLGTEGRKGVAKFFLGSVAENVLRMADCDVLSVPHARVAPYCGR